MSLEKMFDAAEDEFNEFDRIPKAERKHPLPDLCAFLYLHEKLGGKHDMMIAAAEHDEIQLCYDERDCKKLTQADVIYLSRCGVMLSEYGSLAMFV